MAVVKLKFTKSRAKIKANLRYITHRPGREGDRTTRQLFDRAGQTDKAAAYNMIDKAGRGAFFFKLILSPDPRREDSEQTLDLWRLTRESMSALSERLKIPLEFVGVEHGDHTPNRHVHVIVAPSTRLTKADIKALRDAATAASLTQVRERKALQASLSARPALGVLLNNQRRVGGRAPSYLRVRRGEPVYQVCSRCMIVTAQVPLIGNLTKCLSCNLIAKLEPQRAAGQGAGWGR